MARIPAKKNQEKRASSERSLDPALCLLSLTGYPAVVSYPQNCFPCTRPDPDVHARRYAYTIHVHNNINSPTTRRWFFFSSVGATRTYTTTGTCMQRTTVGFPRWSTCGCGCGCGCCSGVVPLVITHTTHMHGARWKLEHAHTFLRNTTWY